MRDGTFKRWSWTTPEGGFNETQVQKRVMNVSVVSSHDDRTDIKGQAKSKDFQEDSLVHTTMSMRQKLVQRISAI